MLGITTAQTTARDAGLAPPVSAFDMVRGDLVVLGLGTCVLYSNMHLGATLDNCMDRSPPYKPLLTGRVVLPQTWQLRGRYPNRGYPKIFKDENVGSEAQEAVR